ncbi:peptidoglycan endopeptidase [Stenotrophomonas sp. NLF4-10]|uniref:peptidoglycan endopeptidase n=1 Tax=Stenotrophomonas sp. NLF4-10 TaxID=2918754 RepID=UPI001EFC1C3A|nr:peptidoglycan endopeptidase [Stenotrophomonas sp. NLF4-10]
MNLAQVERFVAIPYDEQTFDCADLVVLVQHALFGRSVQMPGRRPRGAEGQAALGELSRAYARRTAAPQDGDLVLMIDHGQKRPGHAGVFFFLAHEGWVLHTNERNCCSVLHRVRDLPDYGLRIEGVYRWA